MRPRNLHKYYEINTAQFIMIPRYLGIFQGCDFHWSALYNCEIPVRLLKTHASLGLHVCFVPRAIGCLVWYAYCIVLYSGWLAVWYGMPTV